ncbi:TMV resistance protein N-like [Abrus precatorius]|uniref:TMV resistance protein N-like n=1 Tax=Abrus precatorius TaxID=3816 RepID=A0A8B8LN38_ABRPR|nr:TMV resistance protein N-like [Abrus precatorius]
MAVSPSHYSPSSSFSCAYTYDVFLSFRGEDTRYGFTGNLYKALRDKGIHTFIDDEKLRGGDEITPSLVKAIEGSRIAIPIFSIGYAASSFCLDELATIMNRKDMLVLPVFYNVDPCDVRHQRGNYGKALANHGKKLKANNEKLEKWKMALHQVANLSGYHFKHGDGYEYEFIGRIVELVSSKINRTLLHVANYPVGLESRILEVKNLLDVQSDEGADMVGIHGPGGMGKTTLALAVYNLIAHQFDSSCFLQDARENSKTYGLQYLQNMVLLKTLGEKDIKLASVNEGISIIKNRLKQKKVLLILDDVCNQEQLQAIAGAPNWFGLGSRVIITTRDQQLLAHHNVKRTYEVSELNRKDALQLLSWNAFKSEKNDPSYVNVLDRLITYASGLPLALEVIGSNLYGKNIEAWESAINQYERIPNKKILGILKVSFDALEEEEKCVFLDIACCFKGYDLAEVEDILHAHYGDNMKHHIQVLIDKSLIKIKGFCYKTVTLHGLIREMGKEIVRQESPKEPGKRSRLWFHEDVVQVLEQNEGSNQIEIIILQFPFSGKREDEEVKWDGDAFKKMKSLKTLIIKNGCFSKGPNHLPNNLRVLEWNKYPSEDFPSNFCPKKLAICNLPSSRISSCFLLRKEFTTLTSLNFDWCQYLKEIPNVSSLQNLENLSFAWCKNLCKIHDSIGSLNNLKFLSSNGCYNLKSFPPIMLTSLESLSLSNCASLESFPEVLGEMGNLTELVLIDSKIKKLPPSFQNLTGLARLRMGCSDIYRTWDGTFMLNWNNVTMPGLTEISIEGMEVEVFRKENEGEEKASSSNMQSIHLQRCKLTDEFFLVVPRWLANVKELVLKQNDFIIIPESIKECHFLKKIDLSYCKRLQEIKGIPPNLECFNATRCTSMTPSCRSMLLNQELHEARNTDFCLPATEIPEWFERQSMGTSIYFWFRKKVPELVLCLAVMYPTLKDEPYQFILIINGAQKHLKGFNIKTKHTYLFHVKEETLGFLNQALLENKWNYAEVRCVLGHFKDQIPVHILGGIHLLKQECSMEDIQFSNSCIKRKLDDDLDTSESQHHQLRKKHRFVDSQVSDTQIVQQQQGTGFLSHVKNWARSVSSFLPTPEMQSLDDHVNENSWSLPSNADDGQH